VPRQPRRIRNWKKQKERVLRCFEFACRIPPSSTYFPNFFNFNILNQSEVVLYECTIRVEFLAEEEGSGGNESILLLFVS